MEKRRIENSPTDQEVPGTPDIRAKKKKISKLFLARDQKTMKIQEIANNDPIINNENLSDNVIKEVEEDLKNLDGLMFDEDDFFEEVSIFIIY